MPNSSQTRTQLNLGAFSAYITVDDINLPIYQVEETADSATCWIPSEAGKPFSLHWRNSDRSFNSTTHILIDGVPLMNVCHSKLERSNDPSWTCKFGYRTSETTRRPFMFSEISTTDDDTYLDRPLSGHFGTITLKLTEVKVLKTFGSRRFTLDGDLPDKIHERSKKGMGHQVRLGDEVPCNRFRPIRQTKHIRDIATLTFRYRPREWLQAEGIIEPAALSQEQTRNDANDRRRENPLAVANIHRRSRRIQPNEGLARSQPAQNLRQKPSIGTSTLHRLNRDASSETMRSITLDTGPHAEEGGQEDPTYQRILQLEAELERMKRDYKAGPNLKTKKSNNGASDVLSRPVVKRETVKQESSMIIDLTEVDSD